MTNHKLTGVTRSVETKLQMNSSKKGSEDRTFPSVTSVTGTSGIREMAALKKASAATNSHIYTNDWEVPVMLAHSRCKNAICISIQLPPPKQLLLNVKGFNQKRLFFFNAKHLNKESACCFPSSTLLFFFNEDYITRLFNEHTKVSHPSLKCPIPTVGWDGSMCRNVSLFVSIPQQKPWGLFSTGWEGSTCNYLHFPTACMKNVTWTGVWSCISLLPVWRTYCLCEELRLESGPAFPYCLYEEHNIDWGLVLHFPTACVKNITACVKNIM